MLLLLCIASQKAYDLKATCSFALLGGKKVECHKSRLTKDSG